jgi:hypothetical protein
LQTGERSSGKAYSFNYSILEERTGLHHSRDEARDEDGHIRGNYEVSLSSSSFYILSPAYSAKFLASFFCLIAARLLTLSPKENREWQS